MRCIKVILLLLLVELMSGLPLNQAQQSSLDEDASVVTGSLEELRNSRRVLLLVRRSTVVDARGLTKSIMTEAYRADPDARSRYPRLYNLLAHKLNAYIKRYRSITAAPDVSSADFIILFNLLEFRRPLGTPYPYGEMFVILNKTRGGREPHIIWKTRKKGMYAEDAIGDFIKELKTVRGEG